MGSLAQTSLSPPSHLCSPSSSPGAMPCFQRCCCCVNIRTGGLMMGFMTLVVSIFSIVPMAISLSNRHYLARVVVYMLKRYGRPSGEEEQDSDQGSFEPVEFWGTVTEVLKGGEDNLPEEDDTKVVRLATAMLIFFIVCILLLLVYLACSIMLMYGSVKGSRWLILPWLVATLVFIIAYIAGMILSTILFGVTLLSIAFLTIAIIESCIALYLWACVISLFQVLADRQASSQAWELKPRLNTSYSQSYKGIPSEDR